MKTYFYVLWLALLGKAQPKPAPAPPPELQDGGAPPRPPV